MFYNACDFRVLNLFPVLEGGIFELKDAFLNPRVYDFQFSLFNELTIVY